MGLENLQPGKVIHSPSHEILKDREGVFLRKINRKTELPVHELNEQTEEYLPWGDYQISLSGTIADNQFPVKIRLWKSGDKMKLSNGMHKKVKDILTDQKIPLWVKEIYPVLENKMGEIVVIPKIQESDVVFLFD